MNPEQAADILEVSTNISKEELKKKYKHLVLKHHPDRKGGNAEKFMLIKEAYDELVKYVEQPVWQPQHFVNLNGMSFTVTTSNSQSGFSYYDGVNAY